VSRHIVDTFYPNLRWAVAPLKRKLKTMTSRLSRLITYAAYGATQLPRVAWYCGHGVAMRRISARVRRAAGETARPRAHTNLAVPDLSRLYLDMAALLQQDLANVEAGIYPLPTDHDGPLLTLLERSRLFFEDLPEVHRRREVGNVREVMNAETRNSRPNYYLQNFHFQSGGWMTEDSAKRYDTQVEVLFNGTANATRRQALPQLHEIFVGRDQRRLRLLDVGCGTGRFLDFVKQAWPRLPTSGLDMSEAYVREAKHHLARWSRINLVVGDGTRIPFADASQDAVTSIFMFHELPPKVRRLAFHEFARVLKPGGRLVLIDSLQRGDQPDYEGLLELFPQNFHEPYYTSYLEEDFGDIANACHVKHIRSVNAFVSKVMVFDKA
jgi:ubiquinone/menaquinone biosynthesis C-methylase UbiE